MNDLPERLYLHNSGPATVLTYTVPDDWTAFGLLVAAANEADEPDAITLANGGCYLLSKAGAVRVRLCGDRIELVLTSVAGCDPPTRADVREAVRAAVEAVRRG